MNDLEVLAELQKYREIVAALERALADKTAEGRDLARYFSAARYVAFHIAFKYGSDRSRIDEMIDRRMAEIIKEETNAKNTTAGTSGDA